MPVQYLSKATFTHGTTTSKVNVPIETPHVIEMLPGQRHVGAFQSGSSRVGARYGKLSGVQFELRGQAASGTATPEGDILQAAGFAKSGSTGFTYALGDPHLAANTPSGDTTPILSCKLNVDTQQHELTNVVADVSLSWVAGQIPIMTVDFFGNTGAGAAVSLSGLATAAQPSVDIGPLPLDWQGANVVIGGVIDLVVKEIHQQTRNKIRVPRNASSAFAIGQVSIPRREPAPTTRVLLEMPDPALFAPEDLQLAGTTISLNWIYTAGGTSFNVITCSQSVKIISARWRDDDEVLGYELLCEQDPTTGPPTYIWS